MDKPRLYKTEGIVLRYIPLGEADRIVTLCTPEMGKLRAVARGVRRITSRLGGNLEQLSRVQVMVRRGRNLDVISQAETLTSNAALRGDLWKTTCGHYIAELVDRFSQEELENSRLYYLLRDTVAALGDCVDLHRLMRHFELRLLLLTGYLPEFNRCVDCGSSLAPSSNYFSPALGGVICSVCRSKHHAIRPLSLNALKVLRLFSRSDLDTAQSVRLTSELAVELEHLLRQYIRHVLEQDLKSTDFLDMLRREESDLG